MLPCGESLIARPSATHEARYFSIAACISSISSLPATADVANDVGDVLITFFLVGNDGRIFIITIIIFDGFVDIYTVLGVGNDSLHLAGILLGIGFLERHQLLGLHRLWWGFCCWHRSGARGTAAPTRRRNRSRCDR